MSGDGLVQCERDLIARYLAAVGEPKEGAALFCPVCASRVVYRDGKWGNDEKGS